MPGWIWEIPSVFKGYLRKLTLGKALARAKTLESKG
jgi:hypothetical protein